MLVKAKGRLGRRPALRGGPDTSVQAEKLYLQPLQCVVLNMELAIGSCV
jgi:hypothetical protein